MPKTTATKGKGPAVPRSRPSSQAAAFQIGEGRRRSPRCGLHRGHAGLEKPRLDALSAMLRSLRTAVKWNLTIRRNRGSALVPSLPLLDEVRRCRRTRRG